MFKNRLIMAYHLERHRERFGKLTKPKEFIFHHMINAYLRNGKSIEDLILVPVTFNYDKIYEGDAFPYELLGEEHPQETLWKVVKHMAINKDKHGKVVINYCKPLSLKQFMEENYTVE